MHYKPYPEYKDSGVDYLGKIPKEWKAIKLKYLLSESLKYGANESAESDSREYPRYIRITDLTDQGELREDTFKSLRWDKAESYMLSDGDILLARSGATVGKSFIYRKTDGPACYAGYLIKASCDTRKVNPEYVYNFLQSHSYWEYIGGNNIKATIENVSAERYGNLFISIPPIECQKKICASIARKISPIEYLINKKIDFLELVKEKILSVVMNEQINGSGQFEKLKRISEVISRPAPIVDNDEYIPLGLYNRGRGLFHKPVTLGKDMGDSTFFYVEAGDLILSGQFAWEGAVTMASENENGCVVSHRYPVIRGTSVATEYLLALFMSDFGDFLLNESSRGAAGRNRPLNINLLLNEKIRIPSINVQNEIRRLMYLRSQAEVKVKKSIELLKERRSAFITAAVTGQIDLREESR